jgi:hypothetical protein
MVFLAFQVRREEDDYEEESESLISPRTMDILSEAVSQIPGVLDPLDISSSLPLEVTPYPAGQSVLHQPIQVQTATVISKDSISATSVVVIATEEA